MLGADAGSGQDKNGLKVPGGLAFSEFAGYQDWAVLEVHNTQDLIKVIVGNPVTMAAFRSGIPDRGESFPNGSKMAKIEWRPAKSTTLPYDKPSTVYDVDFIVKDDKRFADSGGWGYGVFVFDATSNAYKPGTLAHMPPQGNDAKCGFACHTTVKARDYVFTEYAKRL